MSAGCAAALDETGPRVLRQDALGVVCESPSLAASFDAQWDGGEGCATVGDQLKAIDALAVEVLRSHGYEVR